MDSEIERLSIGSLDFVPYFYEENYGFEEDGPLRNCELKVKLSQERFTELMDLISTLASSGGYLPVIRHGISDDPIEMRIGPYLWSQDKEEIKVAFALVSPICDEKENMFYWNQPITMNTNIGLINQYETMEKLITTLQEKGILNKEDVLRISKNEKKNLQYRLQKHREVDDVDNINPMGALRRLIR